MKHILALVVLIATPATAQTYGPPDTSQDTKDRREAKRWEIAYQALSAIDGIQTIDCLNRQVCTEANPIYGRNPSKGKVIGFKVAGGIIHYLIFDYIADRNPKAAKVFSKVSVIVQGGVVAANLRFAF